MTLQENIPIIVGVGQVVDHWDGKNAEEAPDPISLISQSFKKATHDTGLEDIATHIGSLAVVRAFSDSLRKPFDPFGRAKNFAASIAQDNGLSSANIIYSPAGGEQPQVLVNEMAEGIARGNTRMALITGGEANAALKAALKNKHKLDWSFDEDAKIEDRGAQTDFISGYEVANGMGLPPQTYAVMEDALRRRLGFSKSDYRNHMAGICARLSETAAKNPYSQFPKALSQEFLATPSRENYPICDPYLKWHVAQDGVNQAASIIMTSEAYATELGISPDKWIYLHGYAEAKEKLVSERPDLSKSKALELVIQEAMKKSGLASDAVTHRDIYSCFPIVVHLAAEVLGLDPTQNGMSVTGGLPFFGGAGNNYSTHAIATMVERLRDDRKAYGLIYANGGFISKHAVGVYSAVAPTTWEPCSSADIQRQVDDQASPTLINHDCEAEIEGVTVRHNRHGVDHAYLFARNEEGRVMASVPTDHRATMKAIQNIESSETHTVRIAHENGRNYLINPNKLGAEMFQEFLSREFKYVNFKRDGHILEVTLNRPESYNALFSAAHFELAEIFDAFEADKDLWVAIITGEGEKAFCSGNDLKVTASGGDMSVPSSGFAGLCSRTDREKPVIAAVNGVAMGGGLENRPCLRHCGCIKSCDVRTARSQGWSICCCWWRAAPYAADRSKSRHGTDPHGSQRSVQTRLQSLGLNQLSVRWRCDDGCARVRANNC